MKRKIPFAWLYLLLPFLVSACMVASGIAHTNAISAPGAKPAKYTTYAWYQEQPPAQATYDKGFSPSLDQHIRHAVMEELQQRGYKQVPVTENPDVLLAYDVSVQVPVEKDKPENFASGFGYSYAYMAGYRYHYNDGGLPGYRPVDLFKEGTLIIDMINPKTNALVWRGWSEGAVTNFKAGYGSVKKLVAEVLGKLS
ncbi:DUF4136 domain-containing protein [Pontibacter liquoris]|uniref:DUF4136 domain-containing protein n=1 Tax=Pontibacter liquoris TaxID=2905677 RepID=UPI001FA73103|nr:DUF4136 domain-containing protein [Pontibacter liquoris]